MKDADEIILTDDSDLEKMEQASNTLKSGGEEEKAQVKTEKVEETEIVKKKKKKSKKGKKAKKAKKTKKKAGKKKIKKDGEKSEEEEEEGEEEEGEEEGDEEEAEESGEEEGEEEQEEMEEGQEAEADAEEVAAEEEPENQDDEEAGDDAGEDEVSEEEGSGSGIDIGGGGSKGGKGAIDHIDASPTCNALIDKVNDIYKKWSKVVNPVRKGKKKTQKADGMNKAAGSGAKIQHSVLGLLLFFIASASDMTKEKLIKQIKVDIKANPPFEIVGAAGKIIDIVKGLVAWMMGFINGVVAIPDIQKPLETIADDAQAVITGIPTELEGLDPMQMMRTGKEIKERVSKVQNLVKTILKEMKEFTGAFADLKSAAEDLKAGLESGDILEKGLQCAKDKKFANSLESYEHIYGKILAPKKEEKNSNCACCEIF